MAKAVAVSPPKAAENERSRGARKTRQRGLPSEFLPILENARGGIAVLDAGGAFSYLNQRACDELGIDRSLYGRHLWEAFPDAEQHEFGDAYRRVALERSAVSFEAAYNGRWYEVKIAPLGRGTYVNFQNIDERRAAADRHRRSEERYRLAARATNDLIWDWNLVTDELEWNENLSERFGYRLEDLGSSGAWWEARIHPDDRRRVKDAVGRVFASGDETFVGEYRFRRADGSYADIHDRGFVVRGEDGRPVRMVGAMQDLSAIRRSERALAERERLTATIFGQAMVGMLHRDLRTRELVVNERFCQIVGRTADELRGLEHNDYTHPDDVVWNRPLFESHRASGAPFQVEKRYVRPDGEVVWCNVHVSFVCGDDGEAASVIVVAEDITSRKAAELELVRSKTLLQTVIDSVDDLIFVKDRSGTFVLTNRALDEGIGELMHRRTSDFFDEEMSSAFDAADRQVVETGKPHVIDEVIPIRGISRSFQTIKVPWLKDGGVAGVIGVSRDITERLAAEEQLRWTAMHDALTGLPNRRLLQERLGSAIDAAAGDGSRVAVLQVDLDQFKQVNDTLGHDAGDALLAHVADRLRAAAPEEDAVARTGGDEFAIVVGGLQSAEAVEALAADVLERLREPYIHDGHLLDCRASVGISVYPAHGSSPEQLLKAADVALYRAKALGRGRSVVFHPEMRADIQRRSSMISTAQDALAAGRVFPFYQPKVDLASGAVTGFEALLRWHDPAGRLRGPEDIAAAFEDPHVASSLSDRIIGQCLDDMRRWLEAGVAFGHIAVNASAADFLRPDYGERLLERLARAGVPTRCFQLEVTESVFVGQGAEHVERSLRELSHEGVHIALDDFGTGYASLRHLRDFPVDSIKLDRSFILDMDADPDDAAIVEAMLSLGRSLGIDVVAEGIETRARVDQLLQIGCPLGQGYLFAKAAPPGDVPLLLVSVPARFGASSAPPAGAETAVDADPGFPRP